VLGPRKRDRAGGVGQKAPRETVMRPPYGNSVATSAERRPPHQGAAPREESGPAGCWGPAKRPSRVCGAEAPRELVPARGCRGPASDRGGVWGESPNVS